MGQIKHKMGKVGGGVDISHKSKMSGKAKNLMSFPGGMPGPGEYGKAEGMPRIVGKGMAKYLAGESVGMRKMGEHYGPTQMDEMYTGPAKKKRKLTAKQQKLVNEVRAGRQAEADKKKKAKQTKDKANKELDTFLKAGGQINPGPGKYDDGPMKTDPAKKKKKDPAKPDAGTVVSGDKSKVSNKTTGMSSAEKKAEMKRRKDFKSKVNQAKRDSKKEESAQMRQVQKDKRANEKVQRQRKSEGKDFVKYKKGTSTDGGAEESVVVRKKLKGSKPVETRRARRQREIKEGKRDKLGYQV